MIIDEGRIDKIIVMKNLLKFIFIWINKKGK
jgi:hypothetical protein